MTMRKPRRKKKTPAPRLRTPAARTLTGVLVPHGSGQEVTVGELMSQLGQTRAEVLEGFGHMILGGWFRVAGAETGVGVVVHEGEDEQDRMPLLFVHPDHHGDSPVAQWRLDLMKAAAGSDMPLAPFGVYCTALALADEDSRSGVFEDVEACMIDYAGLRDPE